MSLNVFGADHQRVWTSSTAKRYGWPARCTVKGLVVRREAEGDKALDEVSAKHVFRTRSVRKTFESSHALPRARFEFRIEG